MRRVVITGTGIWSCLGSNLAAVKDSLYQGKSGIQLDPIRKEFGFRSGLTGVVEVPQLKGLLDRRARVQLSEEAEYAYMSTIEMLKNANLDVDFLEKNETGILFGNDSSAKAVMEAIDIVRAKKRHHLNWFGFNFSSHELYGNHEFVYHF